MKKIVLITATLVTSAFAYNQAPNTWSQKADFSETVRLYAVGFSIGNKGYVGTGRFSISPYYGKDFWEYDPAANTWTQKADFGGAARWGAVGFSIGSKGYLGTGESPDGTTQYYKDFWEYDPDANIWAQKADFGGAARSGAVGFSIGSEGYIGTGYNGENYERDFWEYDPASDIWMQKTDFGGTARVNAVGFSIGSKGYIGTGMDGKSPDYITKDFWEYNPLVNTWTQKTDFGGIEHYNAVGFSIGSKGYIGTGLGGVVVLPLT